MKKKRSAALLGTAAIVGLAIFISLLPRYSALYSIDSRLTRAQVKDMSRQVAAKIGVSLSDKLMENTTFRSDEIAMTYLQSKIGTHKTNSLVKGDSVPLNYWRIVWFDPTRQSRESEKFEMELSQKGKVLSFRINVPDSTSGKFLQDENADKILRTYWDSRGLSGVTGVNLSDWSLKTSEPIKLENRQDWTFTFVRNLENFFGLREQISIRISGDRIISFDHTYHAPTEFSLAYTAKSSPYVFMVFVSWIIIFVLFAIGLIIFLKRYNEGEAGVGSALLVGAAYYIAAVLAIVLAFPSVSTGVQIASLNLFYEGLVVLAALLLLWTPLLGILTFSVWGIGESSTRAQWPEKLFTFDAASHFKVLNEKVGVSTLRGFAFAGILLGIYAISHPIFSIHGVLVSISTPIDSYFPAIQALADSLAIAIFTETFYRFGILSYFGKGRLTAGILTSAILFIPSLFYELPYGEYLILPRILFSIALAAAMIFLFLRYDFLTVLVASALFNLANGLIPIFNSHNPFFEVNSIIVIAFLLVPFVVSFVALWQKQHFELTVDLLPKHIRRISERERMARELEIAKNVQNNLLPRTNPSISHFEFGGICIPALEVGGDYYDFVQMHDGLVGTAIADVSGKGLPAAIYMTLTKGALQAYAEDEPSPRKVLSKINSIVYRSVARGTFISMIYAVMDTKTRTVRFARAGHNPLVFFSTDNDSAKLFTPNGLALGLDNGNKFDPTLEEMEINLKPGDVLVFYTDGFSEAMDPRSNEFGEARLVELIETTRHLPVNEMLEKIESGVKKFVGNAPQHDDMTMVAIKVKAD